MEKRINHIGLKVEEYNKENILSFSVFSVVKCIVVPGLSGLGDHVKT